MYAGPARAIWPIVIGLMLLQDHRADAAWASDDGPARPAAKRANAADADIEAVFAKIRAGRNDDALLLLKEKAAKHPEWPPVQLILARLLFGVKQVVPARRALELAAVEAPQNPEVYLTFGSLALGDGRHSDAGLNFEHALTLVAAGKYDEEKARAYRREAFSGLSAVAESHEDWNLAEKRLKALLELEHRNGQARQRLGAVLYRLGNSDAAFAALTEAVKDSPALEPAALSMARLCTQKGDIKKAEEWFDYAQKVEPRSARVKMAHATWLFESGRAAAARPEIEEAVKLEPGSTEAQRLRALIIWHLRDLPTAQGILEPLHREAPADSAVANLLALTLVEQDDKAKKSRGLQLAEVNASQFPRSPEVAATLGWALYRAGRTDQADQKLRAAVTGVRTTPDVAYYLARVIADKGQTDDARKLLESATKSTGAFAHREDATALLKSLTK